MQRRPAASLKQLSELWTAASSYCPGQVAASVPPALHATDTVSSNASTTKSRHAFRCNRTHPATRINPQSKISILTDDNCVFLRPAQRHQQHEHQRSFASGPKRNKRVQAAIQRRTKDAPQHAEPQLDSQPEAAHAEDEQSVVTADSAASQSEVANVVGHPGQTCMQPQCSA